jgi:DNA polymerase-3 subunit epsilon
MAPMHAAGRIAPQAPDAAHATLQGRYALIDLETTGGDPLHERVMEVAIVLFEDGRVVDTWSSLVNPGRRVPAGIADFTGITDEMVAEAPAFAGIAHDVADRIAGRVFVAHNARFDYGFLRNEFLRLGTRLRNPVLCTVRLSRSFAPDARGHGLDALIARHGFVCRARHRALGDAEVIAQFLAWLVREHGAAAVRAAIDAQIARPGLPAHLPEDLEHDLPEGPGIYRLLGAEGRALFVGSGSNLRARVVQHLTSGEMERVLGPAAQHVASVDWMETAGALGARLLEARLVAEQRPAGNRRCRRPDELHTIRIAERAGRVQVAIEAFDGAAQTEAYGLFRKPREAARHLDRVIRRQRLCRVSLGLEASSGSCVAYQLGECRGACVGNEALTLETTRLRIALAALRVREWPFDGPIGIRDRGLLRDEIHVLDRWSYLGSARNDGELQELADVSGEATFNLDIYRILLREIPQRRRDIVRIEGSTRPRGASAQ